VKYMNQHAASLVLITILAVISPSIGRGAAGKPDPQKKQEPGSKKAEQGSSLTGCVDQQDGNYVLIDDRSLAPIADLVADGFPTEGFAKHVGHKVTVRGISSSGGTRPAMKVRSIETVSDNCAPQQQGKV
jgi:hypothetical protein